MTNLRVLVGDDQIGVSESLHQKAFLRNYSEIADFDFENNPDRFIDRARIGKYDALLIDLNWDGERNSEDVTGFRVLHAVREYSPIRLLHTSNSINLDLKYAAQLCGATNCIEKHRSREYLQEKLKGSEAK